MRASRIGLPAPLAMRVRKMVELAREMPDRAPNVREALDEFLSA